MATPYALVRHERTISTQDDARALIGRRPMLVVAANQEQGRGRNGADWVNAPSALAASLAFRPGWPKEHWSTIPLVAGVAAARALGGRIRLKWPNDLMRDDAKLGGILVEGAGDVTVVGMGVNLHWPSPPPDTIAVFADAPEENVRLDLAQTWAEQLLQLVGLGWEAWPRGEYRALCETVGSEITWEPEGRGYASDVDEFGRLVVETPAGVVALTSGEVREVRPSR